MCVVVFLIIVTQIIQLGIVFHYMHSRYYGKMHFFAFRFVIQYKAYVSQFTCECIIIYDKIGNYIQVANVYFTYVCLQSIISHVCMYVSSYCSLVYRYLLSMYTTNTRLLICTVKCLYESNKTAHLRKLTQSSIIPNLLLKFTASFLYYPTLQVSYVCVFSLKMFYQLHTIAFYCYSSSYKIITYFSYMKRKQLTIFASSSF